MQFTYVNPEEEEGEEGEGEEEEENQEREKEEDGDKKEGEDGEGEEEVEGEVEVEGGDEEDDGTKRREHSNLKVVVVKEEGIPAFSNIFLIGKYTVRRRTGRGSERGEEGDGVMAKSSGIIRI
jgi:hypothetical protein